MYLSPPDTMITEAIETALFDELLQYTLTVNAVTKPSELTVRQQNDYLRDVGLLKIVVDNLKNKTSTPEWLNSSPQPVYKKPSENEPPF